MPRDVSVATQVLSTLAGAPAAAPPAPAGTAGACDGAPQATCMLQLVSNTNSRTAECSAPAFIYKQPRSCTGVLTDPAKGLGKCLLPVPDVKSGDMRSLCHKHAPDPMQPAQHQQFAQHLGLTQDPGQQLMLPAAPAAVLGHCNALRNARDLAAQRSAPATSQRPGARAPHSTPGTAA